VSDGPQSDETGAGEGDDQGETADLESVEIITAEVEEDGTVVVDDLVAEVDAQGNIVATDELVEIDLPDGTVILDETFSVADESGELVLIEEDTTVFTPEDEAEVGAEATAAPAAVETDTSTNGNTAGA
jgi:hypothetical protein